MTWPPNASHTDTQRHKEDLKQMRSVMTLAASLGTLPSFMQLHNVLTLDFCFMLFLKVKSSSKVHLNSLTSVLTSRSNFECGEATNADLSVDSKLRCTTSASKTFFSQRILLRHFFLCNVSKIKKYSCGNSRTVATFHFVFQFFSVFVRHCGLALLENRKGQIAENNQSYRKALQRQPSLCQGLLQV